MFKIVFCLLFTLSVCFAASSSSSAPVSPTIESVLDEIRTTGNLAGNIFVKISKRDIVFENAEMLTALTKDWDGAQKISLFKILESGVLLANSNALNGIESFIAQTASSQSPEWVKNNALTLISSIFFSKKLLQSEKEGLRNLRPLPEEYPLDGFVIVYNQDGYGDFNISIGGAIIHKGAPLTVTTIRGKKVPIGYNVHLPKGAINGVLVRVYGGDYKDDIEEKKVAPGFMSHIEYDLLNKGIAIVHLNLPDLLKLKVFQGKMSEKLRDLIQASIHQFFKTIKYYPRFLSTELQVLEGKKIFLMGHSFGGLLTFAHAENYPGTFDGYICHAGYFRADAPGERQFSRTAFSEHLLTMKDVDKIQDPVLLLHNANDINVDVQQSIDLYNLIKTKGKADLFSVFFPLRGKGVGVQEGHGHPDSMWHDQYVNKIDTFIRKGPSKLMSLKNFNIKKISAIRALAQQQGYEIKFNISSIFNKTQDFVKKNPTFLSHPLSLEEMYKVVFFLDIMRMQISSVPKSVLAAFAPYEDVESIKNLFAGFVFEYFSSDFRRYIKKGFKIVLSNEELKKIEADLARIGVMRGFYVFPEVCLLFASKHYDELFRQEGVFKRVTQTDVAHELWKEISEGKYSHPTTKKIWREAAVLAHPRLEQHLPRKSRAQTTSSAASSSSASSSSMP